MQFPECFAQQKNTIKKICKITESCCAERSDLKKNLDYFTPFSMVSPNTRKAIKLLLDFTLSTYEIIANMDSCLRRNDSAGGH